MDSNISSVGNQQAVHQQSQTRRNESAKTERPEPRRDVLELGRRTVTLQDIQKILQDHIFRKLGIALDGLGKEGETEIGAPHDSSAEATAGRIADFVEAGYGIWRKNNPGGEEDDARKAYIGFISKAVNQGISEARQIFETLGALNGKVADFVNTVESIVHNRMEAFWKPREQNVM
jgi:hypothetical protein